MRSQLILDALRGDSLKKGYRPFTPSVLSGPAAAKRAFLHDVINSYALPGMMIGTAVGRKGFVQLEYGAAKVCSPGGPRRDPPDRGRKVRIAKWTNGPN
jgi:hypothetical protein